MLFFSDGLIIDFCCMIALYNGARKLVVKKLKMKMLKTWVNQHGEYYTCDSELLSAANITLTVKGKHNPYAHINTHRHTHTHTRNWRSILGIAVWQLGEVGHTHAHTHTHTHSHTHTHTHVGACRRKHRLPSRPQHGLDRCSSCMSWRCVEAAVHAAPARLRNLSPPPS